MSGPDGEMGDAKTKTHSRILTIQCGFSPVLQLCENVNSAAVCGNGRRSLHRDLP